MKKSTYMIWCEILAIFLITGIFFPFEFGHNESLSQDEVDDDYLWSLKASVEEPGDLSAYSRIIPENFRKIRIIINKRENSSYHILDKVLIIFSEEVNEPIYRSFIPESWTIDMSCDSTELIVTFQSNRMEWSIKKPSIVIILPKSAMINGLITDASINNFEVSGAQLDFLYLMVNSPINFSNTCCDTLFVENPDDDKKPSYLLNFSRSSIENALIGSEIKEVFITGDSNSVIENILWPDINCRMESYSPTLKVVGDINYGVISVVPDCKVNINLKTREIINFTDYVF